MSDVTDPLSTIAEFSIGLAGFTGIIAAVFNRAVSPVTHFRFVNLLITSFAPGFFALLTVAAVYAGFEVGATVRVASGALAFFLAAWATYAVRTTSTLAVGDGGIDHRINWVFRITAFSNLILQIFNAAVATRYSLGLFILGLTLLLILGAIQFASIALAVLRERTRDGAAAEDRGAADD